MAEFVQSATEVSAGVYRCGNCGHRIHVESETKMPPCPECMNGKWKVERSGDIAEDLHPSRFEGDAR